MKQNSFFYISLALSIILGLIIASYIFGWTTPSANPPSSNLSAPLNTGATNQAKTGYLAVGTSTTPTYPLEVGNQLRVWGQIISKVASGTAPFVIDSPTKVTNLNSDLLDGYDSADLMGGSSLPDVFGNFIKPSVTDVKRVFVTSTGYTGNLGGVSGADQKCQTAANNANLGGTWRAFVLDSTNRTSYTQVFTNNSRIYVLLTPKTFGGTQYYEVFVWNIDLLVNNTFNGSYTLYPFGSWRITDEFGATAAWPYAWGGYYWSGAERDGVVLKQHMPKLGDRKQRYIWNAGEL